MFKNVKNAKNATMYEIKVPYIRGSYISGVMGMVCVCVRARACVCACVCVHNFRKIKTYMLWVVKTSGQML
jgi:hypothetical protein